MRLCSRLRAKLRFMGGSVELRVKPFVALSSTSAAEKDHGNFDPKSWDVSNALNEGGTRTMRIAAGSTESVSLSGLSSVKFIMLRTNRAVTLTIDGEDVLVSPVDQHRFGYFMASLTGAAAVSIENTSASVAEVAILMAGD